MFPIAQCIKVHTHPKKSLINLVIENHVCSVYMGVVNLKNHVNLVYHGYKWPSFLLKEEAIT
jgi:hypothetical protein